METNRHDNRGPELVAIFSVGIAIATIMVSLRLWIRLKVLQKTGWDDWVMLAAWVVSLYSIHIIWSFSSDTELLTDEIGGLDYHMYFVWLPCQLRTIRLG